MRASESEREIVCESERDRERERERERARERARERERERESERESERECERERERDRVRERERETDRVRERERERERERSFSFNLNAQTDRCMTSKHRESYREQISRYFDAKRRAVCAVLLHPHVNMPSAWKFFIVIEADTNTIQC